MAGELKHPPAGDESAALARFVARTQWDGVPRNVQHEAKRALVNFFATALAGCNDPALRAASRVFAQFRAGSACHLIGRAETTDALHAASLNAMSGNVFDYDDTHLPTIIHPTAPVAPALLALAQTQRLSGRDLLLAFVLGVEIECRLGNAISPGHYQRGWHITSTCGVFGAAAAIARAMQLDETRTLWALGNASAQSCGLVENLGTMAKSIGVGNAASNGLLSALLAAQGFEGPRMPVEGPRGFLRVTGEAPDFASLTEGLGERWELMNNTYKPYPCGVVLNPVIEACLALHRASPVALDEVERIELIGHPLLRERTDRAAPHSGREAQVSAQHAVAVSLERGKAGLDEFSDACVAEPHWRAFADRLVFIDDAKYGIESATVTLRLRDGRALSHHVEAARGSLDAPLRDEDLEHKLIELAAWGGSGCATAPLIGALWSLDGREDAGTLMPLAAGTA
ncbi:MmgE/PrpD family protein (plasmid) [Variovorax sp. SRS16]|uniref:MmgE/PrpD family protein n=1 Tax=Variovorax sp. SRS16 TaxID=282217 RepID=UPI0013177036|nr:MmgE/PrpD family protein [Variovorax sp. SRS16]VTU45679.1 MmgE/PrpD family protein [Variovorax sp. SRS16]